ncbi:DUF6695 family protein [Reichenbachiella sp.]|uniref:DUF6695 family protein n=3 Tax=Reichenbachiella sp. TaxID=2184521 RepID=UPI00329778C1
MKPEYNGLAIVLSWPETKCKQTGAWYDHLMRWLNINQNGYYKVGHSAIVLISDQTGICEYYDFGRYHSPVGLGRVRSGSTDHDLRIRTKARFSSGNNIINEQDILYELYHNKSCHGDGYILSASLKLNIDEARNKAMKFQSRQFIPYGPLIWNGTNCSRFVASVLLGARLPFSKCLSLIFQPTISASPKGNVLAMREPTLITGQPQAQPQILEEESKWATA